MFCSQRICRHDNNLLAASRGSNAQNISQFAAKLAGLAGGSIDWSEHGPLQVSRPLAIIVRNLGQMDGNRSRLLARLQWQSSPALWEKISLDRAQQWLAHASVSLYTGVRFLEPSFYLGAAIHEKGLTDRPLMSGQLAGVDWPPIICLQMATEAMLMWRTATCRA